MPLIDITNKSPGHAAAQSGDFIFCHMILILPNLIYFFYHLNKPFRRPG